MSETQGVTITKTGEHGAFGGELLTVKKARGGQAPPRAPHELASRLPGLDRCGSPAKPGHAEKDL